MGNVISSVNSTFQRIGTSYMEYTKKFHSYWYECPSYPLIENIVNGVILVPCKCLLVLPIAVVKIPQKWENKDLSKNPKPRNKKNVVKTCFERIRSRITDIVP